MTHFYRPGFEQIAAYRPGKPAPVGESGHSIKLSSNESPYPPLDSVVAAVISELPTAIHRYPNLAAPELTQAIAAQFGVTPDNIALGAGSVEVASQLMHALTAPGDEVMYAWRSFEAYPILARVAGAVPVEIPLNTESQHDLEAMAAAITEKTRLIFVCNPNNPTGTVVTRVALEQFLARVPPHVLVVIDEAYVHFDRDPESPSGIEFFKRYENVAVLHTFSKAYGLAGLRVGYAIAREPVIEALRKSAIPFAVTSLAQAAAVASLNDTAQQELHDRTDLAVAERERIQHALSEARFAHASSQANFVWIRLGDQSEAFAEQCAREGISVRCFAGEGVRVSIGTQSENDVFISTINRAKAEQLV